MDFLCWVNHARVGGKKISDTRVLRQRGLLTSKHEGPLKSERRMGDRKCADDSEHDRGVVLCGAQTMNRYVNIR